ARAYAHAVHPVCNQRHLPPEELGEAPGDGRERVFGLELALRGTAEVRSDHHRGALLERVPDRRHRGADARVVGDAAILERHVQIRADEYPFAAQVHVGHALELHRHYFASATPTSAKATATSSMRLEKPHSLSYQEYTLTRVPSDTLVIVASKIELAGLWLKSEDTSGSVLYSRMPLRSPSAACFTA